MIEFTWDVRKARRNERIHGVSFPLAQAALETRLGVELEEQYRDDEWRTIVVAPLRGIVLLQITLAFYPRSGHEDCDEVVEEADQSWAGNSGTIRIISARKATTHEQALYFAFRPQTLG